MAKRKFDEMDAQAEREANAIKKVAYVKPKIVGHRLQQARRMFGNGTRIIQTRIEKKHV